jgi:Ser/Thr protein kinase RdoA (MazF antagonist)
MTADPHTRTVTYTETLAAAAVKVAASLGVHATDPVILADGANVIVHLSPAGQERPAEATIGSMLRDLHAELRSYPAQLPLLAPLRDIPAFLARPQTRLTDGEAAALTAAYARLTAQLDHARGQSLHGDAGPGNLMAADTGWVWHDFEDTCTGPVAWDLAASTASPRLDGPRILAAYGEPVDPTQLEVCQQLRRLHLTVWYNLYAERLPDLAPRAAELLTLWPVP